MANGPDPACQRNSHAWREGAVTTSQWDRNGKTQRRGCKRKGCTAVETREKPPNKPWGRWQRTD